MAGNAKPGSFYSAYPKKVKPKAYVVSPENLTKDSMNLAKAALGLSFAGLALGAGIKSFKNAFK